MRLDENSAQYMILIFENGRWRKVTRCLLLYRNYFNILEHDVVLVAARYVHSKHVVILLYAFQ